MARFFVPLDVNYQFDDKILRAGHIAECLYVRALALAKRTATEGRLHRSHLSTLALGLPGKAAKHAAALVDVGLWDETDDGWYITGWLKHNLSNDDLTEQKAKIKEKSIRGNHQRHHIDKGVTAPDCELCHPPHREQKSSPQGDKSFPTEEEDQPKTNRRRTEDEQEIESSSSVVELTLVPNPPHDDDRIEQAIELHAQHTSVGKGPGYARTVRTNDRLEHLNALTDYLAQWPDATADELANAVLAVPTRTPLPDRRPTPPTYPPCDTCDNTGWITLWATRPDNTEYSPGVDRCQCPRGQALKGTA